MWGSVVIKTKPSALPLAAADLRRRLRIEETGDVDEDAAENAFLGELIESGVAMIDGPDGIGLAMMRQTWTLILDQFERVIRLPGSPIDGIAEVRYLDAGGTMKVVPASDYRLAKGAEPARVVPVPGASWPACPSGPGVIEIDYTLGAESADDVAPDLKTAIALNAGHLYEHREAVVQGGVTEVPLGVSTILNRNRRHRVAS